MTLIIKDIKFDESGQMTMINGVYCADSAKHCHQKDGLI